MENLQNKVIIKLMINLFTFLKINNINKKYYLIHRSNFNKFMYFK
jgi:hypothetical protein